MAPEVAVSRVAQDIGRNLGEEVYVLAPDDRKYFLGEAVMIGIGGVLASAFLKGLVASTEAQFEEWGKKCGTWISDKVETLVRARDGAPGQEELARVVDQLPDRADAAPRPVAEVQSTFQRVLEERGMTRSEAAATAALVAQAALAVLPATPD